MELQLFRVFKVCFGVRQGSVLSPYLFTVYIDDITKLHNPRLNVFVIFYANDILLISPSVTCLRKLLWHCGQEFNDLDMVINAKNLAVCVLALDMIGIVKKITTTDGREIPWVDEVRYLGIFIVRSTKFKCSVDHAKRSFFRAASLQMVLLPKLADWLKRLF